MTDWNGDGNFDRHDDDFYNNILSENKDSDDGYHSSPSDNGNSGKSSISVGWGWFFLILLGLAILLKL